MEYIFTLKYRLSPEDSDLDQITERLGAAGCDDALVELANPDASRLNSLAKRSLRKGL